jgi:hypothetical protein
VPVANLAKFLGFGIWVNELGNIMFLAAAVFTVVVAFLAWRRGNRAAGWFLIAWALLEGFTMAAAVRFLFSAAANPIAQRILERVAAVRVDGFGRPIHLTCSIGIAASDTLGVWGEHLIAQADAAVYVAKRRGRNQLQMAAPLAA